MSIESAKALVEKVLDDENLAKQIDEVNDEAAFNALVEKLGYSCTAEEFKEAVEKQPISDDLLDQAAGGARGIDFYENSIW
ncbi:Nif11-like leader peptide family RiPP precursor [Eubacteriaceae bacterium ES3]|nr:Nif11-like leader peptide family RiPP precursor [Eubacteriaceae bacterium ES3]